MGAEVPSERDLRQQIINLASGINRATNQEAREKLVNILNEVLINVRDNREQYTQLFAELEQAGYIRETLSSEEERFLRNYDQAISGRDIASLQKLLAEDEIFYNQALQERVVAVALTSIDMFREKGGSVDDELELRARLREGMKWIPGLNIREVTRDEIVEERRKAEETSPSLGTSILRSMILHPDEKVEMQDLTPEIIINLTPVQIHGLLNELYMRNVMLPGGAMARFFDYGEVTEEALVLAREFLCEQLQKK